ncbi:PKD domain-containing protein [Nesterenkonia sp. PF2B19]|uniref:PKD domain-containing protein n=1 Tax=Nesterenkonia sp. PF2B19 TaxID=1881858 RepID=UPI001F2696FB|nr:PKD domain-containing protein [Nesterenkonia sp. PF2B19]
MEEPPSEVETPDPYCLDEIGGGRLDCRERVDRRCFSQDQDVAVGTDEDGNEGYYCVDRPERADEPDEVEGAEDDEDDVVDLLAQLPGAVEEEFSTLQIDGGSVSFEESLLGFGYLNRHTHMFADVEEQIVETELLGFDVEIRAIPESFQWDYGDGNQRTTYQSGEPLPEYWAGEPVDKTDAETPTSHVYTETGVFDVTLTTTFSGQYRVDGGEWVVIPGASDVASSPGEADIWRQSSRNVSGPCRSQEEWGCNGPVELDPGDRPPKIFQDQYDEHGNWIGEHP